MVTVGEEPSHFIDQLAIGFRFPHEDDCLQTDWAWLTSPIGELRVARLDTWQGEIAIAAYLQDETVALLKFHDARDSEDAPLPWLAIGKTSVVSKHRGNGIMPALIALWIERSGEPLLSDVRQSQDAYRMWTRMACGSGNKLAIQSWKDDGSINQITCVNGTVVPNPADGGDASRWLACSR